MSCCSGLGPSVVIVVAVLVANPGSAADRWIDVGSATPGAAIVVDATDTPVSIPDDDPTGASSMITVASELDVVDVNLRVNITHTYAGDLELFLIGPDGTAVLLSDQRGGSGENYTDTYFDDEAASPISDGSPPFTGAFQPDESLSALNGQPAAGVWTFKVVDCAGADRGSIDGWQLQLEVNEASDYVFSDDFEDGDTAAWSNSVP